MKLILILVAILGLAVGCSGVGGVNTEYSFTEPITSYQEPEDTRTWLSPAIPIEISITYAEYGARTPPVYVTVHYGPTDIQRYTSITGDNTDDFAPLLYPLYDDSISHIQMIISSIGNETPYATSYDKETQMLWIDGLLPNEQRTLEVWYSHNRPAQFKIRCSIPSQPGVGYAQPPPQICNWVNISQSNPVLQPFETRDIPVVLQIPPKVSNDIPSKFEFRVSAQHRVIGATANVVTKLESTWRVSLQ